MVVGAVLVEAEYITIFTVFTCVCIYGMVFLALFFTTVFHNGHYLFAVTVCIQICIEPFL